MNISIWQQFSSNNSSSFTVVGQFDSPQRANQAREEVIHLLIEIAKYYQKPENQAQLKKLFPPQSLVGEPLTPIEIEYSQKYDIQWDEPINWAVNAESVPEAVTIVEDLLVVSSGYPLKDTYQTPYPITMLLQKLGANVGSDHKKEHDGATADVSFRATDERVSQLLSKLNRLVQNGKSSNR